MDKARLEDLIRIYSLYAITFIFLHLSVLSDWKHHFQSISWNVVHGLLLLLIHRMIMGRII